MKKRFVNALLYVAMTTAVVSGHGLGGMSGGSIQVAAADTDGKKKVVIWDYFKTDAQKEMVTSLLDGSNFSQGEYVASHVYAPSSDYERQLTLGIASGGLSDLIILDDCSMASFISLGLLGDIPDVDIKWGEYIQGPTESTMTDGRHYGTPFATNHTALFYNRDMFDAVGVECPDENTTWEQFREMTETLTRGGVTGFGDAATNTDEGTLQCLQQFYTAGGNCADIRGGIKVYNLMQEIITDGPWMKECVNWTQSDVNSNFIAGSLAMQQNGPWQIPEIAKDAPGLNYGVTVLPKMDDANGQVTPILGGENIGVAVKNDTTGVVIFLKHYDQTQMVMNVMEQYDSFPSRTEAAKDAYWTDDPIQAKSTTQLETFISRRPSISRPFYSSAIQKGFQEVLALSRIPEQMVEDTQEIVNAMK